MISQGFIFTSAWMLLLSLHASLVTSAVVSPPNAVSMFQDGINATHLNDIFNMTNSLGKPKDQFHCAGDKPWVASYKPRDCLYALGFLQRTASLYGDEPFSWPSVAVRGQSQDKRTPVNTPIRYKWRSCTLTVAMLADVGKLPDAPPPPYSPWELTSWRSVYEAAIELYEVCGIIEGKLGWANVAPVDLFVGSQLGVFFWGTGSQKDQTVPDS